MRKSRVHILIILILILAIVVLLLGVAISYNSFNSAGAAMPFSYIITTCFMGVFILALGAIALKYSNAYNVEINKVYADEEVNEEVVVEDKIDNTSDLNELVSVVIPVTDGDIKQTAERIMAGMARKFNLVSGIYYHTTDGKNFNPVADYALYSENEIAPFVTGETLLGQVTKNKKILSVQKIPDDYVEVISGLGNSQPTDLLFLPILNDDDECIGLFELASFKPIKYNTDSVLKPLCQEISDVIINAK
jgi:hypothetical protein